MGGYPNHDEFLTPSLPHSIPDRSWQQSGSWHRLAGAGREAQGLPGTEGCMGVCSMCISEPTLEETVAQSKKAVFGEPENRAREEALCVSKELWEICKVGI